MIEEKREFTGVWIPKEVLDHPELTSLQKIMYADIASFPQCFMLNKTFAERYKISETSISKNISKLVELGLIEINAFDGRKRYMTAIHISVMQRLTKVNTSLELNDKADLNLSSNIDNNLENNIENINGDSKESLVDNSKNERAELWDALVVELGYTIEDMTKNVRGQLNNAVKQLHDIGATPNDIKSRSKAYRALFPSSAFTAMALVNRWPDLRSMKAQPSKLAGGVDYDSPEREWTFDDKGDVIL